MLERLSCLGHHKLLSKAAVWELHDMASAIQCHAALTAGKSKPSAKVAADFPLQGLYCCHGDLVN